jgi:hypothetical protein
MRGSGVVKTSGEEGRIGKSCRIGLIRGVGVRARRFSCFLSYLYSFIFKSITFTFKGISLVLRKEFVRLFHY